MLLENEVWLNLVPLLSLPLNQHSLKRPDCVFVDNSITEKKIKPFSSHMHLGLWNKLFLSQAHQMLVNSIH